MTEIPVHTGDGGPERPCPFCDVPASDVALGDQRVVVVRRGAGLAVAPRRHAARWRDLSEDERASLAAWIAPAQDLLEKGGAAAPVALIETGGHAHLRIEPPMAAPGPLPDIPHARPLISGDDDALLSHLVPWIDNAKAVDLSVSFLMVSGVELVLPHLRDLLNRGGRLRLLTGDYLDVTEPAALRLVNDLDGDRHPHVFRTNRIPFHPKAWMFDFGDGSGALIVGSSNLSRQALTRGVEWNLRHFGQRGAAPLRAARDAFEALLGRPEVTDLDEDWIDAYEARRATPRPAMTGAPDEPAAKAPAPHRVQIEALDALEGTRAEGYRAGLVVLATGLGKTYLAAFDSLSAEAERVLFVAHREEILTQATAAFRSVRPRARIGRFGGGQKDFGADILFASVQTLSRASNLGQFASDAFDYIVVDEFHHAAAATYRRVIDHFTPGFLLGLTATPDRRDHGDILGLCEENLVYECGLWSGIDRELLSPFRYFGVPDPVEYSSIPWRAGRFDEEELTKAVATRVRAENALEQLDKHGGSRTLGFCVSRRHADFMAEFAREKGLRAAAVHSGEGSQPRSSSLNALEDGHLDIIFAVDMFNEGVDLPSVDTVLMLRPTESPVIWLQQLGRGLRRAAGKTHLAVVDFIGNHRAFLNKARTLLRAGAGEAALRMALHAVRIGEFDWPTGCEVKYELAALDILEALIPRPRPAEELASFYLEFRARRGRRPTASEMENENEKFNPGRAGDSGWLGFVAEMGDLNQAERAAWEARRDVLREIEKTPMTKSYKMLVLRAMIECGEFPGRIEVAKLTERVARLARRNPLIMADLTPDPDKPERLRGTLENHPLKNLAKTQWFELDGDTFATTFGEDGREALAGLASELVDWRLRRYLRRKKSTARQIDDVG